MTTDLFAGDGKGERRAAPLADRLRPRTLAEVVGQEHLLASGRPFRRALESGQIASMILWGPPGCGKTTLARLMADATGNRFVAYSAVTSGVAQIRQVVATARQSMELHGKPTVLFIDEIHRFNKVQQDAFLPHVESGLLILIGATTENPSFEVNSALLSRLQVYLLHLLDRAQIEEIVQRGVTDPELGLGALHLALDDDVCEAIATLSGGDARVALNILEGAARVAGGRPPRLTRKLIENVAGRPAIRHDRAGESHYDLISALIKSLRGSDADGAMYWLARLLEGGEEPLFIARRLVILASEDVGNADPQALLVATSAYQAAHAVGLPEAGLILSQAVTYLATAPKSNAALVALMRAREDARRTGTTPVPLHLRNAPTPLMQELGYGRDYRYAHTDDDRAQQYLPEELRGRRYYEPGSAGHEGELARRIETRARSRGETPAARRPGSEEKRRRQE